VFAALAAAIGSAQARRTCSSISWRGSPGSLRPSVAARASVTWAARRAGWDRRRLLPLRRLRLAGEGGCGYHLRPLRETHLFYW